MKLRLYQHRPSPKVQQHPDDDPRQHKLTENAPANIPASVIAVSRNGATRDLRQQAVLQMQQQQGNAVVRRYLTALGVLPANSLQRRPTGSDNWQESGDSSANDDSHIVRKNVLLLTVTGEKQGTFKGNSTIAGQKGKIEGSEFQLSMGESKGRKSHTTVTFTKELDESTAQFFQALMNNETIKSVRLEIGSVDDKGAFKASYVLELQHGRISRVSTMAPYGYGGSESSKSKAKTQESSQITMIFEKANGLQKAAGKSFDNSK